MRLAVDDDDDGWDGGGRSAWVLLELVIYSSKERNIEKKEAISKLKKICLKIVKNKNIYY